ncbi:MAG TPA: non-homologous end-joining DNA ligase [Planctomycetota bacterium]|nr:non-homologous end-joining DNA ligase [Planctomycetota bacterium]
MARAIHDETQIDGIRITHPDRVVYPEDGRTKLDVVRYYEAIAPWMLPHVAGRPLTLVRCDRGIHPGEPKNGCLYMRHQTNAWALSVVRHVKIREQHKIGDYLVADTAQALVALAQANIIELHPWNSTVDALEQPDRVIFDIDPGDGVAWADVVETAHLIRSVLAKLGLETWPKTTGGKGLHVDCPFQRHHGWDECFAFAHAVAALIEAHQPERFTTAFAKAKRPGRILIDYKRNNRTATAVSAFSLRARPGAPVSVPLSWAQVTRGLRPETYTLATVPARMRRQKTDPWKGYWTTRQRLEDGALAAVLAMRPT